MNHSSRIISKRLEWLLAVVLGITVSCSRSADPPSYLEFMRREPSYYKALADACQGFLAQTNRTGRWVLPGNDKSLPLVIQDLHATEIECVSNLKIGTNIVSYLNIRIGVSRPGFGITWEQNDYGNGNRPWELSANGDGKRTVLYR
jgi:hypothetical protein